MGNKIWTIQEDAFLMHGVRKHSLSKESTRKERKKRPYISEDDPKIIELAEKLSNRYDSDRSPQALANRFMSLTQALRYGSTLDGITDSIIQEAFEEADYGFSDTMTIQSEQSGNEDIWKTKGPHYLMIDLATFYKEWNANNKNVWSCINQATVCD